MDPPRTAPLHPTFRRPGFAKHPATLQAASLRERDRDLEMLDPSPEMKRRRYNNSQGYTSPSPHDERFVRPSMSAVGYHDPRRQPPGSSPFHPPPRSGMIESAPRPSPSYYPNVVHPSSFDESLRLPPLQTRVSNLGPGRSPPQQRPDSQASGVEAMVMTIPYNSKIKVLSRISLPLAPPGPTSPVQDMRGAVIAIEGAEPGLVAEIGHFIREHLNKEPNYLVKTFTSPLEKGAEHEATVEVEMTGTGTSNSSLPNAEHTNPFITYLKTVEYWHERSQEIIKFITTVPSPALPAISAINSVPSPTMTAAPLPTPISFSNIPTDSSLISTKEFATAASTTPLPILQSQKPQTPIALLPQGFSLTMSDAAAVAIPINDAYAPVDHWQWMATLWRGIVGADLVIYVKAIQMGHANQIEREGAEELARFGAVEVRRDCGPWAVTVRVPVGPGIGREDGLGAVGGVHAGQMYTAAGENWRVEEATLRRLGFEVLEIVRGEFGRSRDLPRT
jgi:HMG box factor, other